jgi:hypothetical protein
MTVRKRSACIIPGGPDANIESILALLRPGIPKGATRSGLWKAAVYGGLEQIMAGMFRVGKIVPEMSRADEIGVIGADRTPAGVEDRVNDGFGGFALARRRDRAQVNRKGFAGAHRDPGSLV